MVENGVGYTQPEFASHPDHISRSLGLVVAALRGMEPEIPVISAVSEAPEKRSAEAPSLSPLPSTEPRPANSFPPPPVNLPRFAHPAGDQATRAP